MLIVLSGTGRPVLSGSASPSYRQQGAARNPQQSARVRASSNDANRKELFGFLLTPHAPVDGVAIVDRQRRPQATTVARHAGTARYTAAHSVCRSIATVSPKRSRSAASELRSIARMSPVPDWFAGGAS
jgi:hypothetical protein